VIQVDIEPEELGYNRDVDLGIVGDLKAVLTQLSDEMEREPARGDYAAWIDELRSCRRRVDESLRSMLASDDVPIHPVRLIDEIRSFVDEDTIVVTSGGDIEQWGRWLLEPDTPGGLLRAGQTGSLGVDVPYSIAAKLARPDKRVILLTGDGGFAYHLTEFDTASRYGVPFVAVVADDAVWAQIKHELDITYGPNRDKAVKMVQRRWDQVVAPLGAHGEYVTRPEEIRPALQRAIDSGKPACVAVATRSVVSPETLWGFLPGEKARRIREA
jgi:acetolactate synthase-1/2/3 large subunit